MPACPICRDPNAFPLWLGADPPPTCPDDPAWPRRSLNSICPRQIAKRRQAAELRRLTPDAFDANGTLIPGRSGDAWRAYFAAHPRRRLVI
jgi:hypothetical protein